MANLTCGANGSNGQEVVDAINGNTSAIVGKADKILASDAAWDGTDLIDEQALRDFYGDQSIAVGVGITALSMKTYPDGSVVGSSSLGRFEMRANGALNITHTFSTSDSDFADCVYPIVPLYISGKNGSPISSSSATNIGVKFFGGDNTKITVAATADNLGFVGLDTQLTFVGKWK